MIIKIHTITLLFISQPFSSFICFYAESEVDHKFQSPNRFRLSFDLSSIPSGEKLQAAELSLSRVPILNEDDSNSKLGRILIYDILRPGARGHSAPLLRLIDSKLLNTRKNGTISVDVHPAVERWIKDPKNNHGLLVHVRGTKQEHVRLRRNANERNDTWVVNRPMLFTYTDDGRYKLVSSYIFIPFYRKNNYSIILTFLNYAFEI